MVIFLKNYHYYQFVALLMCITLMSVSVLGARVLDKCIHIFKTTDLNVKICEATSDFVIC